MYFFDYSFLCVGEWERQVVVVEVFEVVSDDGHREAMSVGLL